MKPATNVRSAIISSRADRHQNPWIADGCEMARREGDGVFESIALKHEAEQATFEVAVEGLKTRGGATARDLRHIEERLNAMAFDAARHLHELAQGRVDRIWAVGLTILSGAMAVLSVSISAGSIWIALPFALMAMLTAAPIEEFFAAHHEQAVFREALFLVLSVLGLIASFWIGTLRGLFLTAEHGQDIGPINALLHFAGLVLRYSLGVLAVVSETLAGFKWWRVRELLWSPTAQAVAERDRLTRQVVDLHSSIKARQAEAGIRQQYRTIGARQCLTNCTRIPPEKERSHLHRAAIGAAIALLVLLALFLLAASAAASPVTHTTVALVDLTRSTTEENFKANLAAVGQLIETLPADSRVLVIGVTDSFGHPKILFDGTLQGRGFLDLELRAARERTLTQWRQASKSLTASYGRTNLIGTLTLIPYVLDASDRGFTLYVFSDGRENVRLDLDHVARIDVERAIRELKRTGSIPPLAGVQVFMLGVDPSGKTPAYIASLKAFWAAFFREAGASLSGFRIDRRLEELSAVTR